MIVMAPGVFLSFRSVLLLSFAFFHGGRCLAFEECRMRDAGEGKLVMPGFGSQDTINGGSPLLRGSC